MKAIAHFCSPVYRMAVLGAIFAVSLSIPYGLAATSIENVRQPVWAGRFYPADPSGLTRLIARLTREAEKTPIDLLEGRPLRALIMPHAGYVYSGVTAAHVGQVLHGRRYSTVIVMGPDHRVGFRNNAVSAVSAYQTPLGPVPLSGKADRLRRPGTLFRSSPASDNQEHSVEVILPFLQFYLKEFEFIPIVMGPGSPKENASAIDPLLGPDTLLVVSSDLSHFLSYEEAIARDKQTVQAILELDSDYVATRDNIACGTSPILTLMESARRHNWQPVLLHYSNSGDTAGDRTRVVGYCAVAFLGDPNMQDSDRNRLTDAQGQVLTVLARQTIAKKLGCLERQNDPLTFSDALRDEDFKAHCGTFVTLKLDNQLRGCIGSIGDRDSILEGVKRNAVHAAFRDHRFSPLTESEFERTEIEVSVLTQPRPLSYTDASDLQSKLRPNIDGVIIRKGAASATFLPQVWEQLPRVEDFLSHLCMKAGLKADAWRRGDIKVQTYQVQYFEEHR